jgi:hypothetical protein
MGSRGMTPFPNLSINTGRSESRLLHSKKSSMLQDVKEVVNENADSPHSGLYVIMVGLEVLYERMGVKAAASSFAVGHTDERPSRV